MAITEYVFQAFRVVAIAAAGLSLYYSIRSRRASDMQGRGLFTAKMNVSMGIMLIMLALIQIVLFRPDWIRATVGAIFILLGVFNLFAGLRNFNVYRRLASNPDDR